MGTKPGIALIGVVLTGMGLSGCATCDACRPSKPWGQDKTIASSAQTGNTNNPGATAWANQARTASTNPPNSMGSTLPASPASRIPDPGVSSVATTSAPNLAGSQTAAPTPGTGFSTNAADNRFSTSSQTPAPFPGLSSSQTTTGGVDQNGRSTYTGNTPTPGPQPTWPAATAAGSGMGTKTQDPPPVSTPQTRESSYQTRYPELPSNSSGPSIPKAVQTANE